MAEDKIETAFVIIKYADNTFQVADYDKANFELERPATRLDVRIGCTEILETVKRQDIISELIASFGPTPEVTPDQPQ